MEEKLIEKMLKKCFLQYSRNIEENPLSAHDYQQIIENVRKGKKHNNVEWYEVIEDTVYSYITNQN